MSATRSARPAVAGAVVVFVLALGAAMLSHSTSGPAAPQAEAQPEVQAELAGDETAWGALVFSKTAGFRHDSIPAGIACVEKIGRERGFTVEAIEESSVFTDDELGRYRVVVFLNTTGDVLGREQEEAFERFIQGGGGFVGIHSAADTEYDWAWYGQLVGAYFRSHPPVQEATVQVTDRTHPATRHLDPQWVRRDEWYDFRSAPAPSVTVLLRVDESTYDGGRMGDDHPIGWYHEFDGGRAIYTAGGHTSESFSEPAFVEHLAGAILWAAGKAEVEPAEPGS